MARRQVLDTGMGVNVLSALTGSITEQLQKKRQAEQELKQVFAKALLEEKLKSQFDPEQQAKNRILELARDANRLPFQPVQNANPLQSPSTAENIAGFQTAQEGARNRELDFLKYLLPRGSTAASGVNVFSFDPSTGKVSPSEGGTKLPPGSRVLPTRVNEGEAESIAAARVRGQIGERGVAGETAGRLSAASQGSRLASQAQSILFPDGTPQSFRRDLALKLQDPTGAALVGDQEAQELEFQLGRAIDAQRLAQTGVNFRPDELKRLTRQFIANALADPSAAFLRVDELKTSLEETRASIDPKNRFSGNGSSGGGSRTMLTPQQAKALGAVGRDEETGEYVDADGQPIR